MGSRLQSDKARAGPRSKLNSQQLAVLPEDQLYVSGQDDVDVQPDTPPRVPRKVEKFLSNKNQFEAVGASMAERHEEYKRSVRRLDRFGPSAEELAAASSIQQ